MLSLSLFLCYAMAATAQNTDVPTISPTFSPTTTLHPTPSPTSAPIPAPVPIRPCYSNLTEVEDLVSLKSPYVLETYILCPDTIYAMGSFDAITKVNIDGWKPIFTRANSIFQCGEDGKSSRNCVITGGNFQMMHEVIAFNRESKDNVVVKGITFEDAMNGGVLLAAPGDITFIDCIFRVSRIFPLYLVVHRLFSHNPTYSFGLKNHQNTAALLLTYCDSCSRMRQLRTISSATGYEDQHSRTMKYYTDVLGNPKALVGLQREASSSRNRLLQQGEEIMTQRVTLDGCLFENNFRGSESALTFNGVIYLATTSNQITIKNSIFRNNNFANEVDGVPVSYPIRRSFFQC
jgi:hypothetical protein